MKILYAITKSNWGGAQKHVFDLILNQKQEGHNISLLCGEGGENSLLIDRLKIENIKIHLVKNLGRDVSLKSDFLSFLEIFKIIKNEKPEILHLHSSKIGAVGGLIGRLLGIKKIIYTAHSIPFAEKRGEISLALIYFITWLTVFFSHKTICISRGQLSKFPKFLVERKYKLIYSGVSKPDFLTKTTAQKELQINNKKIVVGTIAELTKNKGLKYAIEAFTLADKQNIDFEYHILGGGELQGKLQKQIDKNKLQDKIFLHGFKENAANYLKAFDFFLLPSINEGFGYVLLEAGYAQIPVLASSVGGIPEIISDRETGLLFKKGDALEILLSLNIFLKNEALAKLTKTNLNKKVKEVFSLEEMLKQTSEIYK
jgi:glycosyltransferase involved in cell wall biosynthesis